MFVLRKSSAVGFTLSATTLQNYQKYNEIRCGAVKKSEKELYLCKTWVGALDCKSRTFALLLNIHTVLKPPILNMEMSEEAKLALQTVETTGSIFFLTG